MRELLEKALLLLKELSDSLVEINFSNIDAQRRDELPRGVVCEAPRQQRFDASTFASPQTHSTLLVA